MSVVCVTNASGTTTEVITTEGLITSFSNAVTSSPGVVSTSYTTSCLLREPSRRDLEFERRQACLSSTVITHLVTLPGSVQTISVPVVVTVDQLITRVSTVYTTSCSTSVASASPIPPVTPSSTPVPVTPSSTPVPVTPSSSTPPIPTSTQTPDPPASSTPTTTVDPPTSSSQTSNSPSPNQLLSTPSTTDSTPTPSSSSAQSNTTPPITTPYVTTIIIGSSTRRSTVYPVATVIGAQSTVASGPLSSSSRKGLIGPIVGGAIGGIAIIAALAFLAWHFFFKHGSKAGYRPPRLDDDDDIDHSNTAANAQAGGTSQSMGQLQTGNVTYQGVQASQSQGYQYTPLSTNDTQFQPRGRDPFSDDFNPYRQGVQTVPQVNVTSALANMQTNQAASLNGSGATSGGTQLSASNTGSSTQYSQNSYGNTEPPPPAFSEEDSRTMVKGKLMLQPQAINFKQQWANAGGTRR